MNFVAANPFRVIGLPANSGIKEITANKGKIEAHLRVGKDITFPYDFIDLFGAPVARTIELINGAIAGINLPKGKLKYAIFWFFNASPIDEISLNHLRAGNPDKALEILARQESFSSLINTSTINLILGNTANSIFALSKVLSCEQYRSMFVQSVVGDSFSVTEEELFQLVIDELFDNSGLSQVEVIKYFTSCQTPPHLSAYAIDKYSTGQIKQIEEEVAKSGNVERQNPVLRYQSGVLLISLTKTNINNLKTILGASDHKYQVIADKLAKEILQCGIDYYNNSDERDRAKKALTLQNYAHTLAVGRILKERCKENVEILNRAQRMESIDSDIAYLANKLKEFQNSPKVISTVQDFITSCKPKLLLLKQHLGVDHELYLRVSTAVANNSLGMLVEIINKSQSDPLKVHGGALLTEVGNAMQIMEQISSLDMTSLQRSRVVENHGTLKEMQLQLELDSIINSRSQSSGQSSSDNQNVGPMVFAAIAIIAIFIIIIVVANQ